MKMPKKAAKAAGGPTTMEKPKGGKTGVNKAMKKASVPQTVAKTTYGDIKPRQKM